MGQALMSYAIIGFGNIGQALARAFARNGIEVSVATTRDPESFASAAQPQHARLPLPLRGCCPWSAVDCSLLQAQIARLQTEVARP
jgi:predicted dinucleotide-binding enzyme